MSRSQPDPTLDPALASEARLHVTTQLLRLAGGDRSFAEAIRSMLWADYCDAGAPLGLTEEAMLVWWDRQIVPEARQER